MENLFSNSLDEIIKKSYEISGAIGGAIKGSELGPVGTALGAVFGAMQIKDVIRNIEDPSLLDKIISGSAGALFRAMSDEQKEELVSKIKEQMTANNLTEDDTASDIIINLIKNFITSNAPEEGKEETKEISEKAPEEETKKESFVGIGSIDSLIKVAQE